MTMRPTILVLVLGFGLAALLAGDAMTVGVGQQPANAAKPSAKSAIWTEIKWPFPLDQWGTGRAFQCRAADCGGEISLYLRAKLGFCNCATGVSDDTELDRVGDLELLSDKFKGSSDGRPIAVGWMNGRSRPYQVAVPYASPRSVLANRATGGRRAANPLSIAANVAANSTSRSASVSLATAGCGARYGRTSRAFAR